MDHENAILNAKTLQHSLNYPARGEEKKGVMVIKIAVMKNRAHTAKQEVEKRKAEERTGISVGPGENSKQAMESNRRLLPKSGK